MARPLDGGDEHPLMPCTRPRDPLGDDAPLLGDEALQFLLGFVIDEIFLVVAEAARPLFPDLSG